MLRAATVTLPNPHVPLFQFYDRQKLEEIVRNRDSLVQHATKVLHPKPKDTSDA